MKINKAFTLLELMVVIATFGIILSILIPITREIHDKIWGVEVKQQDNKFKVTTSISLEKSDNSNSVPVVPVVPVVKIPQLSENEKALKRYGVEKMFEIEGVTFYKTSWQDGHSYNKCVIFTVTEMQNGYGKIVSISPQD